jgi:hypothetical protein
MLARYIIALPAAIVLLVAPSTTESASSKRICQLTGLEDRTDPGRPTGTRLGGITGDITGTDIGYSFEHAGRLNFLFGDTRLFHPDVCEPAWCGTEEPSGRIPGRPDTVLRWKTMAEWESWLSVHGDGAENMASAPLNFDPERCIPLEVKTEVRAGVFAHATTPEAVTPAIRLAGPKVAANPRDKWVLAMGSRILVITADGSVFAHTTSEHVEPAAKLSGPKVAANSQDKWVLVMNDKILVITNDGRVFAHTVTDVAVSAATELSSTQRVCGQSTGQESFGSGR